VEAPDSQALWPGSWSLRWLERGHRLCVKSDVSAGPWLSESIRRFHWWSVVRRLRISNQVRGPTSAHSSSSCTKSRGSFRASLAVAQPQRSPCIPLQSRTTSSPEFWCPYLLAFDPLTWWFRIHWLFVTSYYYFSIAPISFAKPSPCFICTSLPAVYRIVPLPAPTRSSHRSPTKSYQGHRCCPRPPLHRHTRHHTSWSHPDP
jgi:hypothetical protein